MSMNGLNGHFTLNFRYYEQRFQQLGYKLNVVCLQRDQRRCAHVRKRTVIHRIFGIRRRYMVGTLTSKANISI